MRPMPSRLETRLLVYREIPRIEPRPPVSWSQRETRKAIPATLDGLMEHEPPALLWCRCSLGPVRELWFVQNQCFGEAINWAHRWQTGWNAYAAAHPAALSAGRN